MSTNTPAHSRETRTPCTHCFDVTSRRGQTWRCHGALLVISTSLIRVSCPRDFVTLVGHVEEASWNVMAHAQKPDFVFRRKGRVHLNRLGGGASVQSTTGSWSVRISGSNVGYNMFRGSVKSIGYPLHSPVSPSLSLPCVTVCHHISTAV